MPRNLFADDIDETRCVACGAPYGMCATQEHPGEDFHPITFSSAAEKQAPRDVWMDVAGPDGTVLRVLRYRKGQLMPADEAEVIEQQEAPIMLNPKENKSLDPAENKGLSPCSAHREPVEGCPQCEAATPDGD